MTKPKKFVVYATCPPLRWYRRSGHSLGNRLEIPHDATPTKYKFEGDKEYEITVREIKRKANK